MDINKVEEIAVEILKIQYLSRGDKQEPANADKIINDYFAVKDKLENKVSDRQTGA